MWCSCCSCSFLVATRFAQEDRELDVHLPSASTAAAVTAEPNEIAINITRDGNYFVGGQTLDDTGLLLVLGESVASIRLDRRSSSVLINEYAFNMLLMP